MKMKLYYSPGACSLSPHIALREAGLPFDLQKVDLNSKEMAGGGNFTAVNPKGYVPALTLDDGQMLTEGPAIVQYIADRNPESGLAPKAGTLERYRLMEWLNFISSELHKTFAPLFHPEVAAEWRQASRDRIAQRLDIVEKHLQGKDYLMGKQFTVADGYLFTVLNWSKFVGFDLGKWPLVQAYLARVAARPKVQEALKAEGLVK
jgi:glutathione S-transferase